MLFAQEVFEEGINVHGAHPALQSHGILLDFLGALALVRVGWRDAQVQGQLRPCLDFFGVELAYELEQGPATEGIAIALGWRAEELHQLGGVGGGCKAGVAVEDEGGIGVVDGVVGHVAGRRGAVIGHVVDGQLLGLAGGRYGGEAWGGGGRRCVLGA